MIESELEVKREKMNDELELEAFLKKLKDFILTFKHLPKTQKYRIELDYYSIDF